MDGVHGLWKHEEPLQFDCESELDTGNESPSCPISLGMSSSQPSPTPPKSIEKERLIAERQTHPAAWT